MVGPGRGSRVTRPVEAAARCGVAASPDGHGVGRGAQGPDPSSRARLFCLVSSLLGTHFYDLEKRIPVQETLISHPKRYPGFLLFVRTDMLPHFALSAYLQSHTWTSTFLSSMREAARTSHNMALIKL